MSDTGDWKCRESLFIDFLVTNPCLDGDADLQWWLYRTYWQGSKGGHRNALNAVMAEARKRGVTCTLYTDPETKRKLEAKP